MVSPPALSPPPEQSEHCLLLPKPEQELCVTGAFYDYPYVERMEELMEKLRREGPFVAKGAVGPKTYVDKPFALRNRVGGQKIYGWKLGAQRTQMKETHPVVILGARVVEEQRKYIYFTPAVVRTYLTPPPIRYVSSSVDSRVYVTSYRNFQECVVAETPRGVTS